MIDKLNSFYEELMPIEECRELFDSYAKTVDGFVIFGASQTGIRMARILENLCVWGGVLGYLDEVVSYDEYDGKKVFHSANELINVSKVCFVLSAHTPLRINMMQESLKRQTKENSNFSSLQTFRTGRMKGKG